MGCAPQLQVNASDLLGASVELLDVRGSGQTHYRPRSDADAFLLRHAERALIDPRSLAILESATSQCGKLQQVFLAPRNNTRALWRCYGVTLLKNASQRPCMPRPRSTVKQAPVGAFKRTQGSRSDGSGLDCRGSRRTLAQVRTLWSPSRPLAAVASRPCARQETGGGSDDGA